MADSSGPTGGIGIIGALGILFVALKLMGYIDWSWWWVTLPFWGGAALVLTLIAITFGVAFAASLIGSRR
jgi:hypothetical protein